MVAYSQCLSSNAALDSSLNVNMQTVNCALFCCEHVEPQEPGLPFNILALTMEKARHVRLQPEQSTQGMLKVDHAQESLEKSP